MGDARRTRGADAHQFGGDDHGCIRDWEQWNLRILYPSREAVTTTTEFGEEHGSTFDITMIRQHYIVTQSYSIEHDDTDASERLVVYTRYYADEDEHTMHEIAWPLTDDGEHVASSGDSIETVARHTHFATPALDIEIAIDATE